MCDKNTPKNEPDKRTPEKPISELDELKKKAEEYLDGWKRAKADYANLEKDVQKRQMEFVQFANEEIIRELLPLVDNFKQAFKHIPEDLKGQDWVEGIRHISSNLDKLLAFRGIKEIETVGEKFNPELHEAIEQIASDKPSGTIIEELKLGFVLNGKVIQPARVKVAK
ncbi:nucleotide exchange factor GrpE [Patescibacteria group bacterium]|nr:nucleotide exchange factor GrpE [Patescibacteria group bacterium]MBU1889934.1 nucleotide exchange factor GrpE [Patescibacteria group bacterium]